MTGLQLLQRALAGELGATVRRRKPVRPEGMSVAKRLGRNANTGASLFP